MPKIFRILFLGLSTLILNFNLVSAKTDSDDIYFPTLHYTQASISPDGGYISLIDVRQAPRSQILILNRMTGTDPYAIDLGDLDPLHARWVSDDRLMIVATARTNMSVVSIFEDEQEQNKFVSGASEYQIIFCDSKGDKRIVIPSSVVDPEANGISSAHISKMSSSPDEIAVYVDKKTPELLRINIDTGKTKRIAKGQEETVIMRAGPTGREAIEVTRNEKNGNVSIKLPNGSKHIKYEAFLDLDIAAYHPDGNGVYISKRDDTDKYQLYFLNKAGQYSDPIAAHERLDFDGLHSMRDGRVLGAYFSGGPFEHQMFDDAHAKHMKAVEKYFGEVYNLDIVDADDEEKIWVLHVEGSDEPGAYYVYDQNLGTIDHLVDRFSPTQREKYSPTRVIHYYANDGLPLFGFFTRPKQADINTPLIIMPHGGPHSRDIYGFDHVAQFLASRGYQVFQPQFRGSTGQGKTFEAYGFKDWGGKMQTDISDGMKALKAEGFISGEQTAIVGFSYGGYAALWGMLKQDDIYNVGVAINPVSDIRNQIEFFDQKYWRYVGFEKMLHQRMGNPETDASYLDQRSPINFIQELNTPLLVVHGTYDDIVPIKQSRDLAEKAKQSSVPLTYVEVDAAGHSLESNIGTYTLGEERVDYYKDLKNTLSMVCDFLDKHFYP